MVVKYELHFNTVCLGAILLWINAEFAEARLNVVLLPGSVTVINQKLKHFVSNPLLIALVLFKTK